MTTKRKTKNGKKATKVNLIEIISKIDSGEFGFKDLENLYVAPLKSYPLVCKYSTDMGSDFKNAYKDSLYYGMLNQEEKAIYEEVYVNPYRSITLKNPITIDTFLKVMENLYFDFPQFNILFPDTPFYTYKENKNLIFEIGAPEMEYEKFTFIMEMIMFKLKPILKLFDQFNEDIEKYFIIYQYLVMTVEYSDTDCIYEHSIIGSLLFGKSLCDGMAEAFKFMCNLVGLPCIVLGGYQEGSSVGHMWNLVPDPAGNWRVVDVTNQQFMEDIFDKINRYSRLSGYSDYED